MLPLTDHYLVMTVIYVVLKYWNSMYSQDPLVIYGTKKMPLMPHPWKPQYY